MQIEKLVAAYTPLKFSGKNLVGFCSNSLHNLPSLRVLPHRGFFRCDNCGWQGGPVEFVMISEGLDRAEAQQFLASWGKGVEYITPQMQQNQSQAFGFHTVLATHPSHAAGYLLSRGVGVQAQAEYLVGYCPEDFSPESRFNGRIIFPIRDWRGRFIGFAGRTLGEGETKYTNSSEAEGFSKARNLYGLYEARQQLTAFRQAVVVEGYMDVIMAHQAGVKGVVAVMGSSFCEPQINLLQRFVDEVVLCFDPDSAGDFCTENALESLQASRLRVKRVRLPVDPGEYFRTHSGAEFMQQVSEAPVILPGMS